MILRKQRGLAQLKRNINAGEQTPKLCGDGSRMEECGERLGFTYKLGYNNQHGYMLSRREEKFGQSCFEKVYGDWSRNCLCVKKSVDWVYAESRKLAAGTGDERLLLRRRRR
ncbi:hypothetical protein MRX96_030522 [Rhipicephalus microplus]